jgi:ATPase
MIIDFSVLKEDISKLLEKLSPERIVISNMLFSYVERLSRQGSYKGYVALRELQHIREYCQTEGISLEYIGQKPAPGIIERITEAEVNASVIEIAYENGLKILTADRVTESVGKAKGLEAVLIKPEKKEPRIGEFFDERTMSVHLKENHFPYAKKGEPGRWEFEKISEKKLSGEAIREIAAELSHESVIEIDREGSTIVQLGDYRIVITRPPFSDGWEITAVRPVKLLELQEYELSEKLMKRIDEQAEGILVAGSPGQGKTTFARALAIYYADSGKIVKTIEAPRDLILPESITQFAISHGSSEEIHDILLLSRPDYTIFDEMRNTEDFRLFSDLRLSGVGMIGIVHATRPVDAIQRFIGRIELGVIPQIIDTVVFIKGGAISKVYEIRMTVKVPSGMTEADLARPVVAVADFETGIVEFEIYTYGEETVVIPVKEDVLVEDAAHRYAAETLEKRFQKYSKNAKVEMVSNTRCKVFVPEEEVGGLIGKGGQRIAEIEKELGIKIDIEKLPRSFEPLKHEVIVQKRYLTIRPIKETTGKEVEVYIDGEFLLSAKVSKKNIVKISRNSEHGKKLYVAHSSGKKIELRA